MGNVLSRGKKKKACSDIDHTCHITRACPFFLSRDSQAEADIVLLPYNYLVDATARMSQQIDLTNAIVIFDEAHNLVGIYLIICFQDIYELTKIYTGKCLW